MRSTRAGRQEDGASSLANMGQMLARLTRSSEGGAGGDGDHEGRKNAAVWGLISGKGQQTQHHVSPAGGLEAWWGRASVSSLCRGLCPPHQVFQKHV